MGADILFLAEIRVYSIDRFELSRQPLYELLKVIYIYYTTFSVSLCTELFLFTHERDYAGGWTHCILSDEFFRVYFIHRFELSRQPLYKLLKAFLAN